MPKAKRGGAADTVGHTITTLCHVLVSCAHLVATLLLCDLLMGMLTGDAQHYRT